MAHELSIDILRQIRQAGTLTRAELAKSLGISLSLVSKITAELRSLGLIEVRGTPDPNNGRPADRLAIRSDAGYCIGLDVGSDRKVAVITNLAGEIVASLHEPSPEKDFPFELIEDLVRRILSQSGVNRSQVLGLGVGICNIVDPVTGMVYRFDDFNFSEVSIPALNVPIRDQIVSEMPFPHIIVDDIVRGLGTAEVRYGLAAGESNFIYLLVDTGIGMAIMLNGTPFIGASHIAGEIAHIPVGDHNIQCICGNNGCLN
ncbi:MAG: ROK family transcriptional regulator, partial [Anaerolineaceae bacterium]|nr:ROK family transcriptional regulator [Anaerolineaceae bacterium]